MNVASRRSFIKTSLASGVSLALPAMAQAPAVITSESARPKASSGLQIGDVTADRAIVWSRADRPSRLIVERALREDFSDAVRVRGPLALETSDFTARVDLTGLPSDREIFIRIQFEEASSGKALSEPLTGRFLSAPRKRRDVSFAWSGDTAGQGWGIDESRGGMRTYRTMLDNRPDFFIHSGDHIYADCPVERELKLPDGGVWRNVVTEEKSVAAQTLDQFRGNYKYNWLDQNFRAFHAAVPLFAQWDDHEVTNDWAPAGTADETGYAEDGSSLLVARARRAFHEFMPMRAVPARDGRIYRKIAYGPLLDIFMLDMRSYRDSTFNQRDDQSAACILGAAQLAWLKRELVASDAIWKVIAADMPIGLFSEDGIALGDGPPERREHEIADLLSFMKRAGIRNTVWLTADMHYTAAHHYDPNRAAFQDFEPFWEFVSGPLHAGTWAPAPLDNTFGPKAMFQKGCSGENLAPCFGMQFFGRVDIDGKTEVMTVTLKDVDNRDLWSVDIEPRPDARPGRIMAQHI
jgi:alkaline phosphatase D